MLTRLNQKCMLLSPLDVLNCLFTKPSNMHHVLGDKVPNKCFTSSTYFHYIIMITTIINVIYLISSSSFDNLYEKQLKWHSLSLVSNLRREKTVVMKQHILAINVNTIALTSEISSSAYQEHLCQFVHHHKVLISPGQ